MSAGDRPLDEWVREHTDGLGADIFIDAVGPGAPSSTSLAGINALRRGGRMVDIGGMAEPLPLEMFRSCASRSASSGRCGSTSPKVRTWSKWLPLNVDLSVFEHKRYPLRDISKALKAVDQRNGGFTNVVIVHE
jgi:alcohol dehydrogenase